jgi:hypothetical protein
MNHLDTAARLPSPGDLDLLSDVLASVTSELEGVRVALQAVENDGRMSAELAFLARQEDTPPLDLSAEDFRALYAFARYFEQAADDLRETSSLVYGFLDSVLADEDSERWRRPEEYEAHRARMQAWYAERAGLHSPRHGDA